MNNAAVPVSKDEHRAKSLEALLDKNQRLRAQSAELRAYCQSLRAAARARNEHSHSSRQDYIWPSPPPASHSRIVAHA